MSLGLYRASVLAVAGVPVPHPTKEDHEFIWNAYQSGWNVKQTADRLKERVSAAELPRRYWKPLPPGRDLVACYDIDEVNAYIVGVEERIGRDEEALLEIEQKTIDHVAVRIARAALAASSGTPKEKV